MSRSSGFLGLFAVALVGVTVWIATRPEDASPPVADGAGSRVEVEDSPGAPPPAVSDPPLPVARPRRPQEMLELPDGTFVLALNGTESPQPLSRAWRSDVPFSPIVGVERSDAGVDWYVHEDGTRSTTVMVWRDDLGRMDALTRVSHPGPPSPPVGADPRRQK